ncbi:MAG: metallophosphoesterase [Myxococcales bacterium]|nr:metallophosphoesterase [Myxococcales bacterium]
MQTINELLAAPDRPVELLETLLRIVVEGEMKGCANVVVTIAMDSARPSPVRADAIEAVAKVGTPADKEAAAHALLGEPEIDPQIGGSAVDHLFPSPLDVTRLLELLRRSAQPPSDKTSGLARILSNRVYERTPVADRARLLSGILDLVQDPGAGEARRWLLAPFARIVIAHASTSDDEVGRISLRFFDEVARGMTFETRHDLARVSEDLRALLRSRHDLRCFLFWEQAAQPAPDGEGRPTRYHAISTGRAPLWRISVADLDWLERDALSRDHIADKLLAFDAFLSVQIPAERAEEMRARTAHLAASHSALKTRFERRSKRSGDVHLMEARWAREQQMLENRQHQDYAANLAWFREHLVEIRSGESLDALVSLWYSVPSSGEDKLEIMVRELTDQLDAEIAQAAQEGWRRSWRTVECPLPHEKKERNIISDTATIGLAGLSIDLEQGLDLASLSADAATQAARLATHAMNRFPPWIEPLVRHHGRYVEAVFVTCIRADYAVPAQHDVLGLLAYAPQPVQEICAPVLGELIQAGDPADTRVLEQVLAVLLALQEWRTVLARLAPERSVRNTSDLPRFALWWTVWLAADPATAVESLTTQVADDGKRAGDRVLVVCERIRSWIERDHQTGFVLPGEARALTSFLVIVLTHVPPSDDVRHVGAYVVGVREHAERLRGQLIQRLAAIPGQETVDGLVQIADNPQWPEWRDWLLSLAERRRADDLTVGANDVAAKLLEAYRAYGLAAPEHLAEVGLRTVSMTASPLHASAGPPRTTVGDAASDPRAIHGPHTLRILHISDLHLRGPRDPDRARRVRVLGDPWLANVTELRSDGRFDLVAFTGDVAFSGQLDEYLELMERTRNDGTVARWLDETLTAAGCSRDDLYVVPGNHDVARDVHASAWRTVRDQWDHAIGPNDDDAFARWLVRGGLSPRGMDAGVRERLLERTASYRAWIAHGLGRPDLLPTPSRSQFGYRVTRRFARLPFPIHIIGLDSAWLAGDDHDARRLRLTDEQILRLCAEDDGERLSGLRIALVHHPLADLADGERARRLLQEYKVDLLLSGHLHDPEAREIATPDGHLRDLAAGCLYQHDRYRNGVTAMTLDLDDAGQMRHIEFRFRSWSDRGHWHDDDSLYGGSKGGRLVWPARSR